MFPVPEQKLLDQKNNILKSNWLTNRELEEIKRSVDELEQGSILEEVEVEAREICDIELPDVSNENVEIDDNDETNVNVREEEKIPIQWLKGILSNIERKRLPSLRGL